MWTKLTTVHFQLTGRCNLSCRFCGQSKGMLACVPEKELALDDWKRLARELKMLAEPALPMVTLWGGEPLLYPDIDELARFLKAEGFRLEIVTNGTMMDQHSEMLCSLDTVNVSVDGPRDVHDSVRGAGVFDKLKANLPLLRERSGKVVFLTTVSDANVVGLSRLVHGLIDELHPDGIVLQPLMYLSQAEIDDYRAYSVRHFGQDYPELACWHREDASDYERLLERELENVRKETYDVPVVFTPHGMNAERHCCRPWYFLHVRHDGEVGFCTDYFGFSAGNVMAMSLGQLFLSQRAEAFRRAVEEDALPTCRHCPWRLQERHG